jgi:hypothetical protein
MATFLQLQDDALERLNLPTASSSDSRTRIKRFINEGYKLLLADVGMSRARDTTATISVTAATAEYTVTASKIRAIRDTTNDTRLTEVSLSALRSMDPGDDSDGNPTHYAVRQVGATTLKVRLWPIPSENVTLSCDVVAAVTALSADGDIPVFPEEYHSILSVYARMCEYEKMDDTRYQMATREYTALVRSLRYYLRKSDTQHLTQSGGPRGYTSSLGPDFPDRQ